MSTITCGSIGDLVNGSKVKQGCTGRNWPILFLLALSASLSINFPFSTEKESYLVVYGLDGQ